MLASVEREAAPELEQEALDVVDEGLLQFALAGVLGEREEVEDVGVLDRLQSVLCVVGLQRRGEVRQGVPLALVQTQADLALEVADRPAVLRGLRAYHV